MKKGRFLLVLLLGLVVAFAACGRSDASAPAVSTPAPAESAASGSAPAMSDAINQEFSLVGEWIEQGTTSDEKLVLTFNADGSGSQRIVLAQTEEPVEGHSLAHDFTYAYDAATSRMIVTSASGSGSAEEYHITVNSDDSITLNESIEFRRK